MSSHTNLSRVSAAGLLIALGIIYGDIGTSPLYVFNAITKGRTITNDLIIGSLSCILWTITLQTTLKYVWDATDEWTTIEKKPKREFTIEEKIARELRREEEEKAMEDSSVWNVQHTDDWDYRDRRTTH